MALAPCTLTRSMKEAVEASLLLLLLLVHRRGEARSAVRSNNISTL